MNILVFRIGSIGDTVVALPALKFIRESYPNAKINLLTNLPDKKNAKLASSLSIVDGTGFVDEYLEYRINGFNLVELYNLYLEIREFSPDLFVYLMPKRTFVQLLRDWLFFKLCRVGKILGLNFSRDYQLCRPLIENDIWESEANRLLRLVSDSKETPKLYQDYLNLQPNELSEADEVLKTLESKKFFAFSVGTKISVNDWGEESWLSLTKLLSVMYPNYGLVLIGSQDEFERCNKIANKWGSQAINLCGKLPPRISAAVIQKSELFIGHDSGPMHLAGAVGASVLAIFSARNLPGEWYPIGTKSYVIYHKTDCFGCRLDVCYLNNKKCISSISVDEVVRKVNSIINPKN